MIEIEVLQGDITNIKVDAIVNAANKTLLGGGGVDGAIHRVAGYQLLEECKQLGGCETGEAKITKGYHLPAKYVIHTVGPIWHGGDDNEDKLLSACYHNALKLAEAHNVEILSFPAISTGVYGFPLELATKIALKEVGGFSSDIVKKVKFVCFDALTYDCYKKHINPVQTTDNDSYRYQEGQPKSIIQRFISFLLFK